jgi:hypothetical protein
MNFQKFGFRVMGVLLLGDALTPMRRSLEEAGNRGCFRLALKTQLAKERQIVSTHQPLQLKGSIGACGKLQEITPIPKVCAIGETLDLTVSG